MAKIETYIPGSFCWAELATSDIESAKRFYSTMFNWEPVDLPIPNGSYTIFRVDGNDAAAAYAAQPGVSTHWGLYFSTADADETAANIVSLGGQLVMEPFDVMDSGRMAAAQDPMGAHFSIWQANRHIGASHGGPFGQVVWPELTTTNPEAAVAFYSGLFGWQTKPAAGIDTAQYVEFQNGGASIGGLMPMRGPEWEGIPPHWMCYVTVPNCDERAAKAAELGATVCVQPTDIPNVGRFSVITDIQGATFSIIQMTAIHQTA